MITGLLVAAGKSSRMGECKAFLHYKKNPFIINILFKMSLVCDEIIIVAGYDAQNFIDKTKFFLKNDFNMKEIPITKLKFIINYDFETGMFSSLQKGLASAKKNEWILYHFIDQPAIPQKFYLDFSKQTDSTNDWIQPIYDNKKGHPVLISKNLSSLIINENPAHNLRDIFNAHLCRKKYWECNYPEILNDIDTPEDYQKFKKNIYGIL